MKRYSLADTIKRTLIEVLSGEPVIGFSVRESYSSIYPLTYKDLKKYKPDWVRYPDEALVLLPSNYIIEKYPTSMSQAREIADRISCFLPLEGDVTLAGYAYIAFTTFFTPDDIRKTLIKIEAPIEGACDRTYKTCEIFQFKDGSRIVLEGERSLDYCGYETVGNIRLRLKEIIGEEVEIEEYEEF